MADPILVNGIPITPYYSSKTGVQIDKAVDLAGRKEDLRTNAKTTLPAAINELKARIDQGLDEAAIEEQAQIAMQQWLDDHPEATTTVQDNSLTEEKFTNDLKLKTIKEYVTPEQFGAVGDGITDDSDAVSQAVATGKTVLFTKDYVTNGFDILPRQTIINYGLLRLKSAIVFKNVERTGGGDIYSSFNGGRILISNSPAFHLTSINGHIRRFTISNVFISSTNGSNEQCKAIFSEENMTSYVSFATLKNIKVYNCYAGFYGTMRGGLLEFIVEQCHHPIRLIGSHNTLTITGQAFESNINKNIVYVNGSYNEIIGNFWDVGVGRFQDIFVYFTANSVKNDVVSKVSRLFSENMENPMTTYGTHASYMKVDKSIIPESSIVTTNIKNFSFSSFLADSQNGYLPIYREDATTDGIIEITLPNKKAFFGFDLCCFTGNYAPYKFEVYLGETLLDSKLCSINQAEWYPWRYDLSRNSSSTDRFKIKLYINSEVRLYNINFYMC